LCTILEIFFFFLCLTAAVEDYIFGWMFSPC
jgi:hypothetical protein